MGFFSWKTSDTKKSIANIRSRRKTFPVHMITKCGQVFTEESYEGYGDFGGKDFFELIAELNELDKREGIAEDACPRDLGHALAFECILTNGERNYPRRSELTPDGVWWSYEEPIEAEGGKTPNQLMKEGFVTIYPNGCGDLRVMAEAGYSIPKLVEHLPDVKAVDYINEWNKLEYPEPCEFQGFFY